MLLCQHRFKKNGCKINDDIERIEYHEKDCNQRDIDCPETCPEWCKEIIPASSLFDHLKTAHEISFNEPDFDYEEKGSKYIFNERYRRVSF